MPSSACAGPHRALHTFPARRSSALSGKARARHSPRRSTPRGRAGCASAWISTTDRKSTRLNSSHRTSSYAVFCLRRPAPSATHFPCATLFRSLGEGPRAPLAAAIDAARSGGVRISLDLNYRPALWQGREPRSLIEPLVRGADLLIGNRDAVRIMLGIEAPDDSLAQRLAERYGCRHVALTRREVLSASEHGWSAALYDASSGGAWQSRRYQVRVVDRVGGGDSFAAGLIAALAADRDPADAVQFAAAAGALKLTIPGDWNRATPQEIEQLVRACA